MARAKRGFKARRRRKRVFDRAEGFFGRRNNCYTITAQAVDKAGQYAYVGRKRKKRDFRRLWVTRINAAARACGTTYSQLIPLLKNSGIEINRKMLAELAVTDPKGFESLVTQVA
ncbi:MAG: 50S ribosomal protein L20, partial [Deltaproteobacteria bacterium]|nr:50S ribosomal protein L20 [Deltaproteobacteria bacterium]